MSTPFQRSASFPKLPVAVPRAISSDRIQRSLTQTDISPVTSLDDDDSIVQFNQPPYVISKPPKFGPSKISISVLYATGLNKKTNWTVQLQLANQIENILLSYDGAMMVPKLGGPLRYTLPSTTTQKSSPKITNGSMDAVLEIRLLEHKVRRKTRVLRCSMVLPLYNLEAVGSSNESTSQPTPTQLRIPCPDGAAIQLEATLVSDEAIWQRKELSARHHKEERRWSNSMSQPETMVNLEIPNQSSSPWDWLCCTLC
jgi:hypothetical protein